MSIDTVTAPGEAERFPDVVALDLQLGELDAEILATVTRRAEVARLMERARMASGGTRSVHRSEIAVVQRYRALGREGTALATMLLRLSRAT